MPKNVVSKFSVHSVMKQLSIIIFLSLTVNSCVLDTVYSCKIKNDSIDKIQVKIIFDKSYLDSLYSKQKSKYISFLKHHIGQDSGVSMINFDTLNMKVDYEVLPKQFSP